MNLIASCKDKLAYFRIQELKYVLTQLGLPKQGKKQELVDKIMLLLSDEQDSDSNGGAKKLSIEKTRVARVIDDAYRKMQTPRTTEVTSRSQTSSDANHVKPREDVNDSRLLGSKGTGVKVRCPCGSSLRTNSMIQCEDPRCQVWQHIECVIIPEKPMEGVFPNLPQQFYCEICRLNRADPFWLTVMHPLLPAILASANFNPNVSNTPQSVEKTYILSRADKELLQRTDYDLQVWCIFLNDKVPFRMQWPQHPDLQVNGIPVRTTNRPGAQLLGINGRDDGPLITTCSREGINKLYLSHCDARTFCVGIRIAKRRTIQQVLSMIPNEKDGEQYEEALARVRRCVGGGNVTGNADSDSDVEVVADSIPVNLRCPMSGSRIRIAGRFKPCIHMGCFDLETFVELNQRSRKWQCPICLKNHSLEKIIIDPYFNRITSMMKSCGEDVNEIDVKPDGSWRVKNESENKDLSRWHLPDGSLSTTVEVKQGVNNLKLIKKEDTSGFNRGLKLGMRKNQNGVWEVSKHECTSATYQMKEIFDNQFQYSMPTSSSDDQSVNQDGSIKIDYPPRNTNNIHVRGTLNFDPTYEVEDRVLSEVPTNDANVIVLSDSDDEDTMTVAPPSNTSDISYPSYGYNNSNENGDYVLPQWQMPTYPQSDLQLFGTCANESDALVCASPFNDYDFSLNGGIVETSDAQNLAACPNSEGNKNLVGNPSAYGNANPPLQTLCPSRSSENPQSELNDHTEMARGVGFHNWISLGLGGGDKADNDSSNGTNSNQQFSAQENDTASLLLSMNGEQERKTTSNVQKYDSIFSHPRQRRSVRPRLY